MANEHDEAMAKLRASLNLQVKKNTLAIHRLALEECGSPIGPAAALQKRVAKSTEIAQREVDAAERHLESLIKP